MRSYLEEVVPEFDLERMWHEVEVLTPLHIDPTGPRSEAGWGVALGRLAPGVSLGQAQAEIDVIAAGLAESHP